MALKSKMERDEFGNDDGVMQKQKSVAYSTLFYSQNSKDSD